MQCFGFIISDERKTLSDEISLAKTEKNAAPHECINNEWLDCGFVLCHRISPEEADLLKICVLPAYRRRGIGKILLEEAKKYAKNNGIKKILLEVAVNNPSAIYFYERFGFQKIAQRKGYYKINQTTVDANVMANESFI
jgi:ribosomal-protein-alanine acetyltransferase